MKKRIFAAILALAMALALLPGTALAVAGDVFTVSGVAFGQGGASENVRFKVLTEDAAARTGTVQVGDGSGPASNTGITTVNIPATVTNGGITYRVTAIGKAAFVQCQSLTSVSIPDSVTAIGDSAFQDCRALASVHIPGSVTSIGLNAFAGCTKLASVYIARPTAPERGGGAFDNIAANAKLYIPMSASGYDSADWFELPREKQVQHHLVSGTVKDSSTNPIAGATVTLDSVVITTNASGHYEFFPVVKGGQYFLQAVKSGYQDGSKSFTLNNNNATGTDITLLATNAVTVTNGTGDGNYTEGATVTITADPPASNKRFKEWTGADSLTFTDSTSKTSATAKFTMPASAVAVTATYEDIPPAPIITIQPANQSVTAGRTATFSVTATGNPTPSYLWEYNDGSGSGWTEMATATGTSYTTPVTTTAMSGYQYRCYIENSEGNITSNEVTLTVTPALPISITPNATFPVGISGGDRKVTVGHGTGLAESEIGMLSVGGNTLRENTDYTKANSASVDITLTESWLNSLSAGTHRLNIAVTSGTYAGQTPYIDIVVTAPGGAGGGADGDAAVDVPKTGDGSMPLLWAGLMLLAGVGLVALRRKRRVL